MSFRALAETRLLDAVKKARAVPHSSKGPGRSKQQSIHSSQGSILDPGEGSDVLLGSGSSVETGVAGQSHQLPKPPAPLKLKPADEVKTLDQPQYDPNRTFPGLTRQKVEKKDRHTKAVDAWTKLLDNISEEIEQDVLQLSRDMNEAVAVIDVGLVTIYNHLKDPSFLIPRSESDLFHLLDELKGIVAKRSKTIDNFAQDLDSLETKRAAVISKELKLLVDRLIAIAHQLPNEIEHIVESETFDLNSVLMTNRKAHAQLLGLFKKTQVEVEVEMLQRWEDGRRCWRQLRYDKALVDFSEDIRSERFADPQDRRELLLSFREKQSSWKSQRQGIMEQFAMLTSESMRSLDVIELQKKFAAVAQEELEAISECYKQLGDLRTILKISAEDRVESLRKELHTYGALKDEPPLSQVSMVMQHALEDSSFAELWRLGGGLKADFQTLSADVINVDICYERMVGSIQERLEMICCGFNLKGVLEERGRLMQLDKVRNLITKLRGVPRTEVPAVITSIVPELEDMLQMDQIEPLFKLVVSECIAQMHADMARVKESVPENAAGNTTAAKKSAASSRQTGKSTTGKKTEKSSGAYIDPMLVKAWSRKLGILYYGSDLSAESQQCCIDGMAMVIQQRECNRLIDAVVLSSSDKILRRMDAEYRKLIDSIANFLESQSSYVAICMTNLGDYFLLISKLVEEHRKEQRALDEKSADELFDLSEDFRIEREDREVVFEQACQVLRASTALDELLDNFDKVLQLLEQIQASYRTYHGRACFAADKYPLLLVDEFRRYLLKVGTMFSMAPQSSHPILVQYNDIFDETIRFNRKFFDADSAAGGVEPRPPSAAEKDPEQAEEVAQPEGEVEQALSPAEPPFFEVYTSPLVGSSELALAGGFCLQKPFALVATQLTEEKDLPGDDGGNDEPIAATHSIYKPPTHPDCPWIRAGYSLPLTQDEESCLDDFDRVELENELAKSFVVLEEASIAAMPEDLLATYRRCEASCQRGKERIAAETEPSFVRSRVPVDSQGVPWVLFVDVAISDLSRVVGAIRDSLVTTVEKESSRRLARAKSQATENKAELTEELEDRLRTHWPRRGRVETGIKQPRETELLSHEEKTWRHIQNVQQRMIDLQKKFNFSIEEAKKGCDDYVNDMNALRNSLSNSKFRNLAALQGVDMRARALTIGFQSACGTNVTTLRKLTADDIASVVSFAMDFRKVCPPQAPGVDGGYSEAEILEIEALVIGQCEEAKKVAENWTQSIEQLSEQQEQSLKSHGEFTKRYEKCAQDLAMSEGLGQKYGAPRRRAQERIRTEISRDEQSAGKIDELLANLQFICDETKRLDEDSDLQVQYGVDGRKFLDETNHVWSILGKLRTALQARAEYLRVVEVPIPVPELPWMAPDSIPAQPSDDSSLNDLGDIGASLQTTDSSKKQVCLEDVFVEVDAACRKETRELYESEGMGTSLFGEGGVPDSLQIWLKESKEKLLGPKGHREKAWKRLWGQTTRFEQIIGRKSASEEEDFAEDAESVGDGLSAPAVCMRLLSNAFSAYVAHVRINQEKQFAKLVRVWEKGREKHERLLRPRLGSPDAAEELAALDAIEQSRSKEFTDSVIKFQSQIARTLVDHTKTFCEDLGVSCKGLVQLIDSSMRLDALKLPPDTAIPKKRLTIKRLRKAQRIKEAVARGSEDLSHERMWACIPFDSTMQVVRAAEALVPDLTVPEPVVAAVEPAKKGAPPKKGEPAPVVETEAPTLVSKHWKETLATSSSVKGAVTTAHRIVIRERDAALAAYTKKLEIAIDEIQKTYSVLLVQEASWIQRWVRQVKSLSNQ